MINFGIIGAGHIAETMAETIVKCKKANMYAIASRDIKKAKQYKERYNMSKAYGSYEQIVKDEKVDIIYIATPHSFHFEQAKMCLENGKNVLCEKAFTVNYRQAEELIKLAEEKRLFLGEAMWTRFMPLAKKLSQLIKQQVIGEICGMTANLNFPMMHKERLIKPQLAGGALLDVGIYPLTIASIVLGDNIKEVRASAVLTDTGVDKFGQYTLIYEEGKIADLNAGMCCFSDGNAIIYGSNGTIIVEGVNRLRAIKVIDGNGVMKEEYCIEEGVSGYEYEVEACINAVENKKLYCEEMTHTQTLKMMRLMDQLREQMGVIL